MTAVERWNEKLREMELNRDGRVPLDKTIEERLTRELEGIHGELTAAERLTVRRPLSPRYRDRPIDLIALDSKGRLIGVEDSDD